MSSPINKKDFSTVFYVKMIEVFKTSVRNATQAKKLTALLQQQFPGMRINFDLGDCDKILRIEGKNLNAAIVIRLMNKYGCSCTILD